MPGQCVKLCSGPQRASRGRSRAHHSARSAPSFLKMPVAEASSFSWPPREWYRCMSTYGRHEMIMASGTRRREILACIHAERSIA